MRAPSADTSSPSSNGSGRTRPWARRTRYQRIVQTSAVSFWRGAIDDPIDREAAFLATLTFTECDLGSARIFPIMNDSSGVELNFSAQPLIVDELCNLRRGAMTVNLPEGPHVAQKSPSFLLGQRLPYPGCGPSQTGDHSAPVNPLFLSLAHLITHQMQQPASAFGGLLVPEHWPGSVGFVGMRQQPAFARGSESFPGILCGAVRLPHPRR